MKNLTWQNPEQLFVAQVLINKVKSKCCGIKVIEKIPPKGESFSDFIATFAMSVGFDTYFDLQH